MSNTVTAIDNKVGIVYDARMTDHKPPDSPDWSHPEKPQRVEAIWTELETSGILQNPAVVRLASREVAEEELLTCHEKRYLEKVQRKMRNPGGSGFRGDMYASSGTYLAASLAAGCSIALAEAIASGEVLSGFAIVRPPGHHAKCGAYSGFCFYNNAMLAAVHLTNQGHKVYVVDWDVHRGDGSIAIMKSALQKDNDRLRYFSIHRWDMGSFYPGGLFEGKSGFDASGRVLKVGFDGCQDDEFYLNAWVETLIPSIRAFSPDIIVVSAGFDAARGDPLGACDVTPVGYATLLRLLKAETQRIALILEGGYNLRSIAISARECVKVLLEP